MSNPKTYEAAKLSLTLEVLGRPNQCFLSVSSTNFSIGFLQPFLHGSLGGTKSNCDFNVRSPWCKTRKGLRLPKG